MNDRPATLGALRRSPWADPQLLGRSVRGELRTNLLVRLRAGLPLFPGIVGYDDSVLPEIVNALLARHDFILLGTRGQAKSRILRGLTGFLDEVIPVVAGSEVHDDPFNPISRAARDLIAQAGDDTPIGWLHREERFVEKLATPDVTIADMIGDVDPIKAARGGHNLGDELTMHYGLLPRANRGIFAINELPDLAGKIQVGLFNVLEEGDVQIKGYPIRLPLDVLMVFTANPEDYTARGKIITPLKDRIGSEIRTHAPRAVEEGMAITQQEAWLVRDATEIVIPDFMSELIERIAFEARRDKRVDQRAGVSQRLPITLTELAVSNAEQRGLLRPAAGVPVLRIGDIYAALPAVTGKIELEYEGELQGAHVVAGDLVRRAALGVVGDRIAEGDLDGTVTWFDDGAALKVGDQESVAASAALFRTVPGLVEAIAKGELAVPDVDAMLVAAAEVVLEALVAGQRISRSEERGWQKMRRRPSSS
ncbi:MAG: magnesium chelatase [Gemmatimonadota bacterium]